MNYWLEYLFRKSIAIEKIRDMQDREIYNIKDEEDDSYEDK